MILVQIPASGSYNSTSHQAMLLQSLLMQDKESQGSSLLRKPWYRRAMSLTSMYLWKQPPSCNSSSSPKRPAAAAPAGEMLGGLFHHHHHPQQHQLHQRRKMRRCSSLRIAASFSHVCLCVPVPLPPSSSSFYSGGESSFRADATPAPPKTSSSGSPRPAEAATKGAVPLSRSRTSIEGCERRVLFLGKSLLEDVVMRQLAAELTRGRGEMEVVRRRIAAAGRRRRLPGPSRLSRVSVAGENDRQHSTT